MSMSISGGVGVGEGGQGPVIVKFFLTAERVDR